MKTLLMTHPIPSAPLVAAVGRRDGDVVLVEYSAALTDDDLADVEVVLGWQMPPGFARRLPRLRWVGSVAAGVDKLVTPDLPAHVRVSRTVDTAQAAGIAQFVVAMALRHARAFDLYDAQQRDREWKRHPVSQVRHRVGVLGTGAMGGEIATWLARIGFEVDGWSRRSGRSMTDVLATSEIVVCALPLTPETDSLLDADAFATMPRGSYLINVARGAHVVEADLIAAVHSGHLAGAALDVQRTEPLPADDPLWTVPGITITPHIAGQSSTETIADQFVASVRALERGEPLPNEIDRSRGY